MRQYFVKHQYDILYTLHCTEVRHVHHDLLTMRRDRFFEMLLIGFFESGEIDEIRYHFYLTTQFEVVQRFIFQVLGYRGDAIRVIERILHDRPVAWVAAYQCDICTVQRGDKRDTDALFAQDGFRHQRSRCMRDSIVHMQDIEALVFDHIDHLARQRRLIWLILKERIVQR